MRILHFYRTYLPETQGGLEEAIRQICLGTARGGATNRVLTLARVPQITRVQRVEAEVIQVPLQCEPASCSMGVKAFGAYCEQARWADLVHIHYPWPFADLVHVVTRIKKPVVLTYHSDIVRQNALEKLYTPLRTLFFRSVDRFVATSPQYAASSPILSKLGDALDVIPLGLDEASYPSPGAQVCDEVKRQFGGGYFLFVGVLRYYKGLQYLIDAAAETGLPVVIAGKGPEEARLKAHAKRANATSVQFAGYVTDDTKQALLRHARAVVFPSCERSEAFGVTLLEGQMHGLPLITCDIGTGTSYVNQNGETGWVVPPFSGHAIANAMRQLEQNPEQARMMGLAGKRRFESLFTGNQVGDRYLAIYNRVLQKSTKTNQRIDR